MMEKEQVARLSEIATTLRLDVMEMLYRAQSGHPGGSLSLADIMSVLYFHDMQYNTARPDWIDRDRFVLSKGHAAPILYATLANAGFFKKEELRKLRKTGAMLQGHPVYGIPGVDLTTGSLGLGLSGACGMAIAAKRTGRPDVRITVIIGDGELGEGHVWEAALAASHFQLDNITAIIDRNRYQNDGSTQEILGVEPLAEKWIAFGWNTIEINGHDIPEISRSLQRARATNGRPTMIVANTIKGAGVSYLRDRPSLHYAAPNEEQFKLAVAELTGSSTPV